MRTKVDLLDHAFDVPGREGLEAEAIPKESRSAITGAPISPPEGVIADSLLTNASSAPHEIFPHQGSRYVSMAGARCYKHFRGGLTGNLLATPHGGYKPMVSTSSAEKKDRPCWQRVLYGTDPHATLTEGGRTLAVFTEEFQRRLWLRSKTSIVGEAWQPFIFSGSVRRTLRVDFQHLRRVLALCEYVYSLGFTKDHLLMGLFGHTKMALCKDLGFAYVRTLDEALERQRDTDELLLAAFTCQRAKDVTPKDFSSLESPPDFRCLIPPTPKTISPRESKQEAASEAEPSSESQTAPTKQAPQGDLFA